MAHWAKIEPSPEILLWQAFGREFPNANEPFEPERAGIWRRAIQRSNRITPENITELGENEIFVFGSNLAGRHGKGAAKQALKWGAKLGLGFGLSGKTYAIPTKTRDLEPVQLYQLIISAGNFTRFAKSNPHLTFLVTQIGCGLAGFKPECAALAFKGCIELSNVHLPASFWKVLK